MSEEKYISEDDLETVDSIYSDLVGIEDTTNLGNLDKMIYLIESYNMEVNNDIRFRIFEFN